MEIPRDPIFWGIVVYVTAPLWDRFFWFLFARFHAMASATHERFQRFY